MKNSNKRDYTKQKKLVYELFELESQFGKLRKSILKTQESFWKEMESPTIDIKKATKLSVKLVNLEKQNLDSLKVIFNKTDELLEHNNKEIEKLGKLLAISEAKLKTIRGARAK